MKESGIGALGESLACRFLEDRGFRIVLRNYNKPWGEIDIIADKDGQVHFFEVKAVSRESQGRGIDPSENLHQRKLLRLNRAIQSYLLEHKVGEWQVDSLLVYIDKIGKSAEIELLEHIA